MATIIFRTDTDLEVPYRHSDGREESITLGRIVKAYADTMGVDYFEVHSEIAERAIREESCDCFSVFEVTGSTPYLYFKVERGEEGKTFLNIHNFRSELPDTTRRWNGKETTKIWTAIDYLMRM